MKLWNVICKLQYYTYIQQKCGQKPKAKWNQSQKQKQHKPKTKSQESSEAKAKSQKPNGHANWLQTAANSTQIRDFGSKMQQIQARSQKPKEPEAKSQKPNGHANWLQTAANSTQIRDFGSKMQQIQAKSQKPKAKSQKPKARSPKKKCKKTYPSPIFCANSHLQVQDSSACDQNPKWPEVASAGSRLSISSHLWLPRNWRLHNLAPFS